MKFSFILIILVVLLNTSYGQHNCILEENPDYKASTEFLYQCLDAKPSILKTNGENLLNDEKDVRKIAKIILISKFGKGISSYFPLKMFLIDGYWVISVVDNNSKNVANLILNAQNNQVIHISNNIHANNM
ncbi:MAG: hypothetical protein MRY83_20130 [Flavobacteriales bacterium]|nr:hypothetical protein [Flavobacteriales bacterium]